jgi:hypothetical protein
VQVRDTLRGAAFIAKATWVDPLDGTWLSRSPGLVESDGTPTPNGEQVLQTRLGSVLKPLLS